MRVLIKNATIVNEGERFIGSVIINGKRIAEVLRGNIKTSRKCDMCIDATGLYLIPGVIDDHVHFREPGLTSKATIFSESRAAAAGGVTSFMDMPNTKPQTTDLIALRDKFKLAANDSAINYSFYFGVTNNNTRMFARLNPHKICGIKLFMGSSTGNMLVDGDDVLESVFKKANLLVAVHCEDSHIIAENTKRVMSQEGNDPDVSFHPVIRNSEACYRSTKRAVELAKKYGTRLHVMHISTAKELELLSNNMPLSDKQITAEVTPAHLLFCDNDYKELGTKIKCNPAIKSEYDRNALRNAVVNGTVDLIGTDHAPHRIEDKVGGALSAASGIPTLQFSLISMLQLCNEGVFDIETIVQKMCHAPADIFGIDKRGYIRKGYSADIVLLDPAAKHTIEKGDILSQCGWSPFEGKTFDWSVRQTWVNGLCVYKDGVIDDTVRGVALKFSR